jgi:hypothetical protein
VSASIRRDEAWTTGPVAWPLVLLLAGVKLALHLATANRYGYFRDELYFLDMGRHLDWGYVDSAPLVAVYAKVALLLGGSLFALRAIAAVVGAGVIVVTALLARELGGRRFAQGFAALCMLLAPIHQAENTLMSMNAFEPLFWMGCVFALIRIVRTGDSRWWIRFGVFAGLGIENKHSTLLFGAAVVLALIVSPERRELGRRWIWLGGAIALLLFLPNIRWQITHGFPTLEDLQNVKRMGKNVVLSPLEFVRQQIEFLHPLLLLVWGTGLVSLLVGRLRRTRVLGWTYLFLLVLMILGKAKNYYLAPIYPMLFAAGAVAIEGWLARRAFSAGKLWPKASLAALVILVGVPFVPAVLPILPPEKLLDYQRRVGAAPRKTEVRHEGPLEQRFGDQFGWPELVDDVARAYASLPPDVRAHTGIFASNYGEAGALHLFGPSRGLPWASCAHQNHFFWGPPNPADERENLVWLQWGPEGIARRCKSVEKIGEHFHPWGMAEENRPIYLCRGLKRPLPELWEGLKHWN